MSNPQKTSILQKNWQAKICDERTVLAIMQKYSISEVLAKLLNIRKIPLNEIADFLDPKIKNILPNPFELGDMKIAVEHVLNAINSNKKITIFGDYDVDGATSSAILKRYFRALGIEVGIYIPDRILEGYGPNSEALLNLKKNGTDLVIMVDCGTVAFEPLQTAKKAGLEIIVIDHHLGVIDKPEAIAIINPNLINEEFSHKNLCAAGVVFLFIVAINKTLRDNNFFVENSEPNLFALLDLVALGTVCDVMPLVGLNRAFVASGLKIMQQRKNLGLRIICDTAGLDVKPNSYSLGFVIGPRINAGGRVGTSNLGATILSSEDENQIFEIAQRLEVLNQERKDIEAQVLSEAIENLENNKNGFSKNDAVIFAVANDWHQGVIGIVASRLKELYGKPVAVLTIDEKKSRAKASCRSINGIDFGGEILKARLEGLLIEGGGHAMAGGFAVEINKIKDLHQFFCNNLQQKITKILQENLYEFDLELDLEQLNLDLIKELSNLEPFGTANSRPKFLLRNVYKIRTNFVGKKQEHLSCIFGAKSMVGFNNQIQAILFRVGTSNLAQNLIECKTSQPINLIGTIDINSWMGVEKLQLQIEDAIIATH